MADSTMPSTQATDGHRPDVAGVLERLRLAEVKLARRREQQTGMNETDRAAMRYLLERVDTRDVTPSMIVRALHLSPASGTALIDRLVARGLVVVEGHPHDRRKKLIRPFDRNIDPDHLDPLTMQLRGLASELPTDEARIVASFLEDVLAMVSETAIPAR
ncbi:MarR family winged helix-turn-helix transcriptional regulator [Microbacterium sp. NPDC056569]|uniref:MarR family winged helix-turn-helix transcriptional regulator n=1 Tax=Microbacterium sp. NPDC056569 TaxID=3345867 RepID=UPI003672A556